METVIDSNKFCSPRVLSFNLDALPLGSGSFLHERIDTFVSRVGNYDILLLQEVYPTSVLPYAIQRVVCSQSRLLKKLRAKGFLHYVVSRQPSYKTMLQYNITSSNGLVIVSRYRISRHGSYTFRNLFREEKQSVTYGCLFAEVQIPRGSEEGCFPLVFFNIHLKPASSCQFFPPVLREASQFVFSVMNLLSDDGGGEGGSSSKVDDKFIREDSKKISQTESWLPFIIAGSFNVDGAGVQSGIPSLEFATLLQEFEPLSEMQNVLYDCCSSANFLRTRGEISKEENESRDKQKGKYSSILATRTPQPFFSKETGLDTEIPSLPREDYFFVSRRIAVSEEKIEKFVVERRPYLYLSDHYGISVRLIVKEEAARGSIAKSAGVSILCATKSPKRLVLPSVVEEAVNENSPITLGQVYFFLTFLVGISLIAFYLSWRFQAVFLMLFLVVETVIKQSFFPLPPIPAFGVVTPEVISGEAPVSLNEELLDDFLPNCKENLKLLWTEASKRYRSLPCLLSQAEDIGSMVTIPYYIVDERARVFGLGLFARGMRESEKIGVLSDACREALIVDLTCLYYGFSSVSLSGKGSVIRNILDHHHIRVACSTASKIRTLLSSRSTSLEVIICLEGFPDEAEMVLAKDLNISILSSLHIREQGRLYKGDAPVDVSSSAVWTYVIDNVGMSNLTDLHPITHADVIREIKILKRSGLIGSATRKSAAAFRLRYGGWKGGDVLQERLVWYFPYSLLFPRLSALAILLSGGTVVTSTMPQLEGACRCSNPSIFIAQPALFRHSMVQMDRQIKTHGRAYRFAIKQAYNLCSTIIHTRSKDCPCIRSVFFRRFQQQLGGCVEKVILFTSHETTSFDVVEHATVCYVPFVREVFCVNHIGICAIDGIPSPQICVVLKPLDDELSARNAIGELSLIRGEVKRKVGLAARWDTHRRLTLLDVSEGVLWPVEYQYAIAVELERIFALSRYVVNVFLFCFPGEPLIAVVYPNKDIVEYAWRQSTNGGGNRNNGVGAREMNFGWKELVAFGSDLILEDLRAVGRKHHLHPSQLPRFIHLHPHAFSDHLSFLNPFGRFCRSKMIAYFEHFFTKIYSSSPSSPTAPSFQDAFPSVSDLEYSDEEITSKVPISVPFTIDIGGTFAKVAYIVPPGLANIELPNIINEASSLSRILAVRVLHFFKELSGDDLSSHPTNAVGTIRFFKVPSGNIADLVSLIKEHDVLGKYKPECIKKIRATGGGAFKYGHIAENLGIKVDVVKEMDAVVKGLNLVLLHAPSSIFTVNPETGEHLPHKLKSQGSVFSPFPYLLINIGSGISFVKCNGPDGSHVRVGGSPIGGATFWGLTRALTHLTTWEEVLEIMRLDGPGDNKNVDLLVGDIYGYNAKDLPSMLSAETVASSFGKFGVASRSAEKMSPIHARGRSNIVVPSDEEGSDQDTSLAVLAEKESRNTDSSEVEGGVSAPSSIDIVRSLLNMLSGNVTQLAYLHSKLHGIKNIFFAGGFVRDNHVVLSLISQFLSYWSSGETAAHFLEYDGYLGALGCIVLEGM